MLQNLSGNNKHMILMTKLDNKLWKHLLLFHVNFIISSASQDVEDHIMLSNGIGK